jgi:DNA helicase-2/ATP-dependent DNA helicase PcrA
MKSGKLEVIDFHVIDERKLFYVGATRARDLLIIGSSNVVNKRGGGPSHFIKQLLGDNMDEALARSIRVIKSLKVESRKKEIYEPRKRMSYSQLAYYLQCPLRYKYFVIDKIEPPIPPYLYFGASVHRALELLHNEIISGKKVKEKDVPVFIEKAWIPSIRIDDEKEDFYKNAAINQLTQYVREYNFTFSDLLKAEESFAFDMNDVVVSGKIDLIRKLNGKFVEIVDFKTTESKIGPRDRTDLQMNLYALGAERRLGYKIGQCTVHFLANNKPESMDWNKDSRNYSESYLAGLIKKINKQEFKPRLKYCLFCDEFKDICPYSKK